jgi:hypothetical protein
LVAQLASEFNLEVELKNIIIGRVEEIRFKRGRGYLAIARDTALLLVQGLSAVSKAASMNSATISAAPPVMSSSIR